MHVHNSYEVCLWYEMEDKNTVNFVFYDFVACVWSCETILLAVELDCCEKFGEKSVTHGDVGDWPY